MFCVEFHLASWWASSDTWNLSLQFLTTLGMRCFLQPPTKNEQNQRTNKPNNMQEQSSNSSVFLVPLRQPAASAARAAVETPVSRGEGAAGVGVPAVLYDEGPGLEVLVPCKAVGCSSQSKKSNLQLSWESHTCVQKEHIHRKEFGKILVSRFSHDDHNSNNQGSCSMSTGAYSTPKMTGFHGPGRSVGVKPGLKKKLYHKGSLQ